MATMIKGLGDRDFFQLPSLKKEIEERYRINLETKMPLDVQEVSKRIGESSSLLLCAMLSQPKCSLFGVNCLIEIMAAIAENHPIHVACLDYGPNQSRPFNFILATDGFLKESFEPINTALGERSHAAISFSFTPEHRISKQALREFPDSNGSFELDLKIDLSVVVFYKCTDQKTGQIIRKSETVPIASVVVEFDGPSHLSDEQVRKDKIRDSMIQSTGCAVFRIQIPYKEEGKGATQVNRDRLSNLLKGQIEDIKSHFQSRLFATINSSYLLKELFLTQPDAAWFHPK